MPVSFIKNIQIRYATHIIQTWLRMAYCYKKYHLLLKKRYESSIKIQSVIRGFLDRRRVKKYKAYIYDSASKIQAMYRKHIVYKKYKNIKHLYKWELESEKYYEKYIFLKQDKKRRNSISDPYIIKEMDYHDEFDKYDYLNSIWNQFVTDNDKYKWEYDDKLIWKTQAKLKDEEQKEKSQENRLYKLELLKNEIELRSKRISKCTTTTSSINNVGSNELKDDEEFLRSRSSTMSNRNSMLRDKKSNDIYNQRISTLNSVESGTSSDYKFESSDLNEKYSQSIDESKEFDDTKNESKEFDDTHNASFDYYEESLPVNLESTTSSYDPRHRSSVLYRGAPRISVSNKNKKENETKVL